MLPLLLSPNCTVYAAAYVVGTVPHTMQFILGQPFLRKNTCSVRFVTESLHFEIANKNQVFRISRPYAENACKTLRNIHETAASQLNSLHMNSVYSARISVIQRDFKVQEIIHPAVQKILDRYPTVMSDIPPDGTVHRDSDRKIELLPGATSKMMRWCRLTPLERKELDSQIDKMLEKHWIRKSTSPWASPVLFVHKSDGGLRMCVDFRKLNAQTIPINYPMPHPQDSLYNFSGSTIFSASDLVSGFNQISIKEEDRHKTAFRGY